MKFTSKTIRVGIALMACCSMLAFAGCGEDGENSPSGVVDQVKKAADGGSVQEKLNALGDYVQATNEYNGSNVTFAFAQEPAMRKMRAGEDLTSFSSPSFDVLKRNLEEAKKNASGFDDIDKATNDVLQQLEKLVPMMEKLKSYYDSKQYTVDGNAEGRKMVAEYLALYDQFEPVYRTLDEAISKHNNELHDVLIEEMKKAGKKNTAIYMEVARDMRLAVETINPEGSPDAYRAKVEEQIAKITSNMAEFQPKDEGRISSFKNSVNNVIGDMRDFMAKPDDDAYNDLIENYNRFIDSVNRIDRESLD